MNHATSQSGALRCAADFSALVVGCGSIGARHALNLVALGCRNVLLVDADPAASASLAAHADGRGALRACASLAAALAQDPTIALIASPTASHASLAIQAAPHVRGLFIEKPLSHTLEQILALEQALRAAGCISMVGCNMRFHPGPAVVHRWLRAGRIGTPLAARLHTGSYLPRWRPHQDFRNSYSADPHAGGAVLDCIHELDLALWLLGSARLHASAVQPAAALGLSTDGLAEILLTHDCGAISSVHLNFVQRNYRRSIELIGSEGSLYWDWSAASVTLFDAAGAAADDHQYDAVTALTRMYVSELDHFLDAVHNAAPALNPVHEAARTLELALAARGASHAHRRDHPGPHAVHTPARQDVDRPLRAAAAGACAAPCAPGGFPG